MGRPWAPMGRPWGAHGPPRAKMARTSRAESGVRNSPPDPPDPADPADPPEMVSGAAVQTLPSTRRGLRMT